MHQRIEITLPENRIPTFDELMNPLIKALQVLGGSGSIEEIYTKTIELLPLPDSVVSQLHERLSELEMIQPEGLLFASLGCGFVKACRSTLSGRVSAGRTSSR